MGNGEDEAELEILNAEGGEWTAVSNGYKTFKLAGERWELVIVNAAAFPPWP